MNKVIRGKKYDTETAEKVASTWEINNDTRWDELYKKKTGEFFLAHHTRWANESERIQPLTLDEAKEWVEENMDGDDYEALFGKVEE